MKKIFSKVMALALAAGLACASIVVYATEDQPNTAALTNTDATFKKTYTATNDGTSSPAETFEFQFTAESVSDTDSSITKDNMPEIPNVKVDFTEGQASTSGKEETVDIGLTSVSWPGPGVYIYTVSEVKGKTAGVEYSAQTAKMKVTVANDGGTGTYYTAFVTMTFVDEDGDEISDIKGDGNFKNTYSAGNLKISKTVTGNAGSASKYFAVTVTLTGVEGKTYADSYTVTGGSMIEDGTNAKTESTITVGTAKTFYLKSGETITIKNLPYNMTYTVLEDDYTTDENGGYDEAKYTYETVTEPTVSTTGAAGTVDSAEETVTITNNKGITVDTGISTERLPYILLAVLAVVGVVVVVVKRRPSRED